MKTSFVATTLALAAASNAFVITNCDNGESTNFGDNKCQIWTAGNFRFQSDAGCQLYVYSEGSCAGKVYQTGQQEVCNKAPFGPVSIRCEM